MAEGREHSPLEKAAPAEVAENCSAETQVQHCCLLLFLAFSFPKKTDFQLDLFLNVGSSFHLNVCACIHVHVCACLCVLWTIKCVF